MKDEGGIFKQRVLILGGVVLVWSILIVFQLVNLQVLQHHEITQRATRLHETSKEIPSLRGKILDRNGKTVAISLWEPEIVADPSAIEDPEAVVNALAKALGKGSAWRKSMRSRLSNKDRKWAMVERRASQAAADKIDELNLKGIYLGRNSWRHYPSEWMASHVVGFVNGDGSVAEGLERSYHQRMKGRPGEMTLLRDGHGRRNGLSEKVITQPSDGADLYLTIDLNIQLFTEDAIRRGFNRTKAQSITALVMNPNTGEVLAMASAPDFNPNDFSKFKAYDRRNRAIVDVYEPGSSFKVVTAAAALDSGSVSQDRIFHSEPGPIKAHDKRIRNHKPYGNLTLPQVLWHSSNSGAVQLALSMENEVFYKYIEAFGFGSRTGIDLPAESPGILRDVSDWSKVSPYFLSMGHEISATPLQMLRALSAVANGGYLVTPFVVSKVVYGDGLTEDTMPQEKPKRVIKEEVADYLADALVGVVERGTARDAAIPGVKVFGKTGTAQRIQGATYSKNTYNSSFVGFFPAEAPRYGIIVVVHDPKGPKVHGGDVAAPIFAEIGRRIMDLERAVSPTRQLNVSAAVPRWRDDAPRLTLDSETMPDFTGLGTRSLLYQSRQLKLRLDIKGTGRVIRQIPRPGSPIPKDRSCSIVLKEG